ncbi:MAG: SDR family NAD(P)-dependent oxidoreductase [Candidatus Hydrogenedens sp.]|nr:SDR family NAD(P)-dependent oxidoreductase [Candidatus Hydrogenedens sp.]
MEHLKKYGGYALITGASAGIGREFARLLAAAGVDCFLVARREARLQELQQELESKHQVRVKYAAVDLAAEDAIAQVQAAAAGDTIGILINNAGFGDGGEFQTRAPERMEEMIRLNCLAPVLLSRAFMPAMIERKRGAMIMVSSALGIAPCPFEAVYGATKAFDLSFGGALWGELEGTGVDVTTICPALTETEFMVSEGFTESQAKQAYRRSDSAELIARITLEGLGKQPFVYAKDSKKMAMARRVMPLPGVTRMVRGFMKRAKTARREAEAAG